MKTNKLREVVRMHLDRALPGSSAPRLPKRRWRRRPGARRAARLPAGRAQRTTVRASRGDVLRNAVFGSRRRRTHDPRAVRRRGCRPASRWTCSSISTAACTAPASRRACAVELYRLLSTLPGLRAAGLHMYDGHIHDTDLNARRKASRRGLCARADDARRPRGGRARGPVRRRRRHADLSVPRAARRRRVQSGHDGLLGFRLQHDAAGSRFRAGGRLAHAGDQQAGAEPPVPGSRAQGGRIREPASARDAVRARGRDRRSATARSTWSSKPIAPPISPWDRRSMACRGTCARRWRCTTRRSSSATAGPKGDGRSWPAPEPHNLRLVWLGPGAGGWGPAMATGSGTESPRQRSSPESPAPILEPPRCVRTSGLIDVYSRSTYARQPFAVPPSNVPAHRRRLVAARCRRGRRRRSNKWWWDNLAGPDSSNFVDLGSDQEVQRQPARGGVVLSVRARRASTRSSSTT